MKFINQGLGGNWKRNNSFFNDGNIYVYDRTKNLPRMINRIWAMKNIHTLLKFFR